MTVVHYDAVVVGAGPYGLSTAAHLMGEGLNVAVFGKTVEMWCDHMPKGMRLRSHWWATNLSDPRKQYDFEHFFRESKSYGKCYPEPIDSFVDYARWFQERAVPNVDATYVSTIERRNEHFLLTLADGRQIQSASVVMAIGLYYYAHRPQEYRELPAGLVSHSSEHNDFNRFKRKEVIVIGGGQSAIEYCALLYEAGAGVHSVSRRPIEWLSPDRDSERTFLDRIIAPSSGIAPGWVNWTLEHFPYLFCRFPRHTRDRWLRAYLPATVSSWVKERVSGKVTFHEGCTVATTRPVDSRLEVTLSDGVTLIVDHVVLATGYQIDVQRLKMIDPSLRKKINTEDGAPVLSPWFESSVPGLYFVGLTSLKAFGPLFRFVAGCRATAPRVARSIARKKRISRPIAFRAIVKDSIARSVSVTGLDKAAHIRLHRNLPFIASYHRVVERLNANNGFAVPAMEISAAMLERHLDWLARNFRIVSLDDLDLTRESPGSRPLAAVTFDDGYSDVYHHAFPILKRKGIPAGMFVVTDLVGTAEPPMHERLHALLVGASQRRSSIANDLVTLLREANVESSVPEHTSGSARDPFSMNRFLIAHLPQGDIQRVIDRLEMDIEIGDAWRLALRPMSWEMLAEMRDSGMTIGSHTRSHASLTNESRERVRDETEDSRREIERRLAVKVGCFAYPGGGFNGSVVEAVGLAGYRYAFTTCRHRNEHHPLLTIPRKMLWERSCLDPSARFSPAIMSCHAAAMFEGFSDCAGDH